MDLACPALEDVIFPGLEYAWHLGLHSLACVEKSTHSVDKVIEMLKLHHQLPLRSKAH